MKITKIISGTYSIIQHSPNLYKLVRVIGEYSTEDEGFKEMMDIFNGRKTEVEVEREYHKSQIDYDE